MHDHGADRDSLSDGWAELEADPAAIMPAAHMYLDLVRTDGLHADRGAIRRAAVRGTEGAGGVSAGHSPTSTLLP